MKTPTHEEVALGAHKLWREAGCPDGRDTEHWFEAEQRLAHAVPVAPIELAEHAAARAVHEKSFRDRAPVEAAEERRHSAREPIAPHVAAPAAKPPESGKPLWNQPHSR